MHHARLNTSDYAARFVAIVCALNLNGIANLLFGFSQSASIALLASSFLILVRTGGKIASTPFLLLGAAITLYLAFGLLFFDPEASSNTAQFYVLTYGASIILLWAVASYTAGIPPNALRSWIEYIRNCLLVSAASVWASPLLYSVYIYLPTAAQYGRFGGFFLNPNEAAMVSLLALTLVLSFPLRPRILQLGWIVVCAGAIALTLSKSGLTGLALIGTWQLWQRTRALGRWVLASAAFILVAVLQAPAAIADAAIQLFDLDPERARRIAALGELFHGDINDTTTTGRTYLWQFAYESVGRTFPDGSGLGSGHYLIGGLYQNGIWQGVHNTPLLFLVESGPIPALLLLLSLTLLVLRAISFNNAAMKGLLAVLLIDLMSTHGALGVRYHNLLLGLVIGGLANKDLLRLSSQSPRHAKRLRRPATLT